MSNPLISVIVPLYNVESYVAKCIDSILAQTYRNFECIIINDGSTDKSRDICYTYSLKDNRIQIIDKVNGGLSSARNHGIDYARGDYLAFVDSDDWIAPQMFETLIHHALKHQADIVVCGHFVVNEKSIEAIRNDGKLDIFSKESALDLILEDREINSFAWDKLYKRTLFKSIRYPVGRIFEDIATTYKLFNLANSVVKINNSLYYYLRRSGSLCLSDNSIRNYHNFLAFFERFEFAKENSLKIQNICLQSAIKQAVCTIDNYALASRKDRQVVPINDILEKAIRLNKVSPSFIKSIPQGKLFLFCLSPSSYYILYKIFHSFKNIGHDSKLLLKFS